MIPRSDADTGENGSKLLYIVYSVIFLDMFAVGMIVPVLPYYARQLGADSLDIGILNTAYGLLQLVGSPVLGRLSDTYGRKPVLLVSLAGPLIGYSVAALAGSWGMLVLSRVVVGSLKQTHSLVNAAVADTTSAAMRSVAMGRVGMAVGAGLVLGPAVGGYMPGKLAAWAAVLVYLVLVGIVHRRFPETCTSTGSAGGIDSGDDRGDELPRWDSLKANISAVLQDVNRPDIRVLLAVVLAANVAVLIFRDAFPLILMGMGLSAGQNGLFLSFMSVLYVLVQALLVGPVCGKWSERTIITTCLGILAATLAAFMAIAQLPSWALAVLLVPFTGAGGILHTCVISALSKHAKPNDKGGLLGVGASLESLARTVSPIVAGASLSLIGTAAPMLIAAGIAAVSAVFVSIRMASMKYRRDYDAYRDVDMDLVLDRDVV